MFLKFCMMGLYCTLELRSGANYGWLCCFVNGSMAFRPSGLGAFMPRMLHARRKRRISRRPKGHTTLPTPPKQPRATPHFFPKPPWRRCAMLPNDPGLPKRFVLVHHFPSGPKLPLA